MAEPTTTPGKDLERVCLLLAGAVGAGVHAGLAPSHLGEWPPLGVAFLAAAVVVSAAVAALAVRPASVRAASGLGLLLAGLVAAYAATRLAPLPPLDPEREPLDAIGLCTNAIEAAGVVLAFRLVRQGGTP
jgi:hypothetical protein